MCNVNKAYINLLHHKPTNILTIIFFVGKGIGKSLLSKVAEVGMFLSIIQAYLFANTDDSDLYFGSGVNALKMTEMCWFYRRSLCKTSCPW